MGRVHRCRTLLRSLVAAAALLAAGPLLAADVAQPDGMFGKLLVELTGLFVVATVMESALALLFQWRLYREFFNGRAVKTLVMIAVGYAVVVQFDYDTFSRIARLAGGSAGDPLLSKWLSACVLAGGSAAVFELFKALGLRPPVDPAQEKPRPPSERAWVSVKLDRKDAVGDIKIHIVKIDPPDPALDALPSELAGVVAEKSGILNRLKNVFLADRLRLPAYGGLTLESGKVYRIFAEALAVTDQNAKPVAQVREIYRGRFAGRAIVDFIYTF